MKRQCGGLRERSTSFRPWRRAVWIWNIVEEHFYGATQVVDLYHAREHSWMRCRAVSGRHPKKLNQWTEERRQELNEGRVQDVINAIDNAVLLPGRTEGAIGG